MRSDTAAAVLGSRYGLTHYRSMSGRKSIEGSVAFFVVTLAITYCLLLQWSAHDNSELLLHYDNVVDAAQDIVGRETY